MEMEFVPFSQTISNQATRDSPHCTPLTRLGLNMAIFGDVPSNSINIRRDENLHLHEYPL
jgi:hypothetical protein